MNRVPLLEKLIKCKAVTENITEVNNAIDIMHEFLLENNIYCTVEQCPDGRKVLYGATEETKAPDVLLNAHLDVVPATEEQFIPRIEGDIMYGRGTGDCQGNATILADLLIRLKGKASVGAIFSTDEEHGGISTSYMVRHGYTAKKIIIVIDGNPYAIAIAQKGIIDLALRANSKGGHSSTPWDFNNPIDMLIDGYIKLRNEWTQATQENQWGDTMAPTILNAGFAHNQIPDVAEMLINIRFINSADCESIIEKIKQITGLEVIIHGICEPFFADENTPVVQKLMATMKNKYPEKDIPFVRMNGATDARHFAKLSAPIAVIGTEHGGIHTANEWVRLSSIDKYTDMLEEFILEI